MKTLTKKIGAFALSTLVFVVFLFAACLATLSHAHADKDYISDKNITVDNIYYFTDYYPTVSYKSLQAFGKNLTFDHQYVKSNEFTDMVESGYFSNIGYEDTLVIIDIKTFLPDNNVINALFYDLRQLQDCKTLLVSAYDEDNFDTQYIDAFVCDSQFVRLGNFIDMSLNDMNYRLNMNVNNNTAYLIDGDLADIEALAAGPSDLLAVLDSSPFLQKFMESFDPSLSSHDSAKYIEVANKLIADNVLLLVQISGDEFVDVLTGATHDVHELMTDDKYDMSAFGFINFSYGYYSQLKYMQNNMEALPIYAFIVDSFNIGDDGLIVITDENLLEIYGNEFIKQDYAEQELYDLLYSLLG